MNYSLFYLKFGLTWASYIFHLLDATTHPKCTKQWPLKNFPSPNVSSAEAENPDSEWQQWRYNSDSRKRMILSSALIYWIRHMSNEYISLMGSLNFFFTLYWDLSGRLSWACVPSSLHGIVWETELKSLKISGPSRWDLWMMPQLEKEVFADVIRFRILRWGDYFGLSSGP